MKVLPLFVAVPTALALINPILPGWNPDPSIIRVGEDYFITTSTLDSWPGHPIYHSKDLIDWELIGHGLNRPSQLSMLGTPPHGGIWAPTLRFHNGTYYLATTTRYVYTPELRLYPRSFYVTTDDIFSNEWSDPIYFDSLGYDPDLFWDVNGDVYSTWAGINNAEDKIYGIWQNKIDISTGTSLTEAELIFNGTLELNATSRPEGPHVYFINDMYYLVIAEGGTGMGHRATVQRGPSPSGPWENNPANPIMFNGADLSLTVQRTGHVDLVEGADGQWWGTALATRLQNRNASHQQLGRETFLFPVHWEEGWPIINNGKPLVENDPDMFHEITEDGLVLHANSYALGDRDNPAAIFRRQASYWETFETEIDFQEPHNRLLEAGITAFYDDYLHNEVGITGADDGTGDRYIIARTITQAIPAPPWPLTPENNTVITTQFFKLSSTTDPVKLRIIARPDHYTLSYAEGLDAEYTDVGTVDASVLSISAPGGSSFKGAEFGVYNTGTGRPSLLPATFKYWIQTPDDAEL